MHATVVECRHLPKTELIGKSDPYVRVYLMPGTHAELKTKVMKKTQKQKLKRKITTEKNSHPILHRLQTIAIKVIMSMKK